MSFYYAIKILLLKFFYRGCDIGIIYTYLTMLKVLMILVVGS